MSGRRRARGIAARRGRVRSAALRAVLRTVPAAALGLWLAAPVRVDARPNVVVVSLDTVRADAIEVMPVLQALAARGVAFVHALSTAPWTVPSHAALLTGRNPLELSCDLFNELFLVFNNQDFQWFDFHVPSL